ALKASRQWPTRYDGRRPHDLPGKTPPNGAAFQLFRACRRTKSFGPGARLMGSDSLNRSASTLAVLGSHARWSGPHHVAEPRLLRFGGASALRDREAPRSPPNRDVVDGR